MLRPSLTSPTKCEVYALLHHRIPSLAAVYLCILDFADPSLVIVLFQSSANPVDCLMNRKGRNGKLVPAWRHFVGHAREWTDPLFLTCTSRPISNSNGIKVMKEVEAITKPTYSAFWPSHRVWVDSHVPPLVKDTDAFWKNPLIPPATGSDFLTMVCCVLCFSTAMAQQIKKLEF